MSVLESQRLSDAVTLHTFTDPRFKTMKVSVNLFLPLEQATAARNAILPSLASRATRAYPDYTALNGRQRHFQPLRLWGRGYVRPAHRPAVRRAL